MRVLPYLVAVLQIASALIYFYNREYRIGLVWLGVGFANVAMAGVR